MELSILSVETQKEEVTDEVAYKYPLRMGRYLTQEEREDIKWLVPDTGPDWSDWKRKLESREISATINAIT